jgi:aminoglycoside phosphotransferase (APT) family kinase protein
MATPAAEIDITVELARAVLLAHGHADLSGQRVRVVGSGWDNTIVRIGDDWLLRMPRRAAAAELIVNEQRWLPELAPRLPLPIPAPVIRGVPSAEFPWPWTVSPWLRGQNAASAPPSDVDHTTATLADFLKALHVPAPPDAPANPFRGVALARRAEAVHQRLEQLADTLAAAGIHTHRVADLWESLSSAPRGTVRHCGCTATCTRRTCSPIGPDCRRSSTGATSAPGTPLPTSPCCG